MRCHLPDTWLAQLLLCSVLLGVAFQAPSPSRAQFETVPEGTRAEVGEPIPSFEIQGLRDSSLTYSSSDFEGRYLLLNLWATWCAPCIEKIPTLKRIRDHYDEKTLAILNVSFDKSRTEAEEFLKERGIPGKHAYAGGMSALVNRFGNSFAPADLDDPSKRGLPNATLVGPDGEVLARLRPPADGLNEVISKHLPGPPIDEKREGGEGNRH